MKQLFGSISRYNENSYCLQRKNDSCKHSLFQTFNDKIEKINLDKSILLLERQNISLDSELYFHKNNEERINQDKRLLDYEKEKDYKAILLGI